MEHGSTAKGGGKFEARVEAESDFGGGNNGVGARAREHFIPWRKAELVDRLCAQPGLTSAERSGFRQLCELLDATLHFEYLEHFEKLKTAYAPFDPDADTLRLTSLTAGQRHEQLDLLFDRFDWLLERANFNR